MYSSLLNLQCFVNYLGLSSLKWLSDWMSVWLLMCLLGRGKEMTILWDTHPKIHTRSSLHPDRCLMAAWQLSTFNFPSHFPNFLTARPLRTVELIHPKPRRTEKRQITLRNMSPPNPQYLISLNSWLSTPTLTVHTLLASKTLLNKSEKLFHPQSELGCVTTNVSIHHAYRYAPLEGTPALFGSCNKLDLSVRKEQTFYWLCGLLTLYTLCKPPAAPAYCAITPVH